MNLMRPLTVAASLAALLGLGASCAPQAIPAESARRAPSLAARSAAAAATTQAPAGTPGKTGPISAPMAGEPPSSALNEARLVSATCDSPDKLAKELAEARIAKMEAEVDAQLATWAKGQPDCWRMYREQEEYWKRFREHGGLGLSGIGEGGGGYGEGMGLGSIGTIGHASGVGYGQGFGSGHGRLGAAHRGRAASFSGTNNQVVGVDEADIVKTDGRYVYLATNGALRIVEALNPRVLSVTKLGEHLRDILVEGDRAVAFTKSAAGQKKCTYGYDCTVSGDGTRTAVVVLDLTDRTAPKIVRRIELSGTLVASRRIGNAVHTVVTDNDRPAPSYSTWPDGLETCGTREASVRRKFAALKAENRKKILAETVVPTMVDNGVEKRLCTSLRTAVTEGRSLTSLVSFDLTNDQRAPTTVTIQSRPGQVFASESGLYLSVLQQKPVARRAWYSSYASIDELSEIHKFRISADSRQTRYLGTGIVPGHALSQFSMDEWNGYLRVATTRGRVPNPNVASVVSILADTPEGNLVRVGAIDGIAPGEDIRAVRFDAERGYVVTFKKTDPLFVLDLHDAARPAVLGELKIPGFSTYIHRIDATHLLSIGYDADEHGDFAYFDGLILQLFDVSEPTHPRLMHKEKIGTRGSSSEAATDHLAFNYFADRGLLAVPMTICEGGGDGRHGHLLTFSGLLVYSVSTDKGFRSLGGINHGRQGANCSAWWSQASSVVKRSVFLDDLVYSIAMDKVKVQRLAKLGTDVADLPMVP